MAVKQYEENGKSLWMVYVNIRSKEDPRIRNQKRILGIESEKAAISAEKKLLKELSEQNVRRSSLGITWEDAIGRWELTMREDKRSFSYEANTVSDHVGLLRNCTKPWLKKAASEIYRGDARELFNALAQDGRSHAYLKHLKSTINVVFRWGIEQRLILGIHESPVHGLSLEGAKAEKVPDILTLEEIRKLLHEAKIMEHEWYPVWATALLTGMRNGELHALLWTDVDFDNRRITVSKSYHSRRRFVKSTKSGYWRNVPISDELHSLLLELKAKAGNRIHVLPRLTKWDDGLQAEVLRAFCRGIGIRSVKFHALRACFATQLLAHDIAPARVMKICGWRDLKTMQYYIRLAGVDERGATQVLKVMPSDAAVMGEVVNMFDFKGRKD